MSATTKLRPLAVALVAAAIVPVSAYALQHERNELMQAAAACVPAQPTDPIRNRVGGVRNSGQEAVYIICAMSGDYGGDSPQELMTYVSVRLANTGAVPVSAQCTLHTGYGTSSTTTSQGNFVISQQLPANDNRWFEFDASDFLEEGQYWANPTFICKVMPKVEVMYVFYDNHEDIGT